MIKLIESGLFGDRLVPVDTPLMVERYNECLHDIGFEKTELKKFHIDGWGWSPEIAEEKADRFYLSHGLANPYSIIITPEQKSSPLYMPYHTFDWDIHRQVFENYELQIQDITAQFGMWFELDQSITAYRNPRDLLMMEVVNVHFKVTGDIQKAAQVQKELVTEYSQEPMAWLNKDLRNRIIDSSKEYGDLRYRSFELPDFPVSNVSTYYTVAYGGLYVLKKVGDKPILIYEDDSSELSNDPGHAHKEYNIHDQSFMPFLFSERMVESTPEFFRENLFLLELQLDFLFAKAAIEKDDAIDITAMNDTQKKGMVSKLVQAGLLGDEYLDLESLVNQIRRRTADKLHAPATLNQRLLHPTSQTNRQDKIVLWQLLAKLQNCNPVLQYAFDKSGFFTEYQTWNEPLQLWAINAITANKGIFKRLID